MFVTRRESSVCGEGALRKWCHLFIEARTSVHDEERSGRPALITDDLKEKMNAKIRENRQFTFLNYTNIFWPTSS
jgi:hypothetical protein